MENKIQQKIICHGGRVEISLRRGLRRIFVPALAGFQRVHRLGDFIMSVTPPPPPCTPIQNASDLGGLGCF